MILMMKTLFCHNLQARHRAKDVLMFLARPNNYLISPQNIILEKRIVQVPN